MASAPGVAFSEALKALQAGQIASLYLLHGEEAYLQEELLAQIRSYVLDPATADLNHQRLDAEECSPEDIRTAAETLPFIAAQRLVVVRRAESLEEEKVEELKPVLENPPESACLVLLSSSSLKASSPLLKTVRKSGVVVSTEPLKGKPLSAFVRQMASRLGFSLEPEALALLLDRTGGSLRRAASELDKLSLHVDGKEANREEPASQPKVSLEMVAAVVDEGRTENLFDLTDALGARNAAKALASLQRLLRRQHNPSALVAAMGRHFVKLLQARALLDEGVPLEAVPQALGGHPFYARKLTDQARRFSEAELREAVERSQRTDILLRGSGLPDWALLEELTLALCGVSARGGKGGPTKRRPLATARRAPAG